MSEHIEPSESGAVTDPRAVRQMQAQTASTHVVHIPARSPDDTWCLVVELPGDFSNLEATSWATQEVQRVLRESGPGTPLVLVKPESIRLYWLRDCPRRNAAEVTP